ncbi:MAG: hypothetical protein C0404_07385, partial [Verrucomicrobia bacterium]|nr:hypothetical protein [Verrucomicrobiota bacterium]
HRIAGVPGIPGSADGSADLACLASVSAIACNPNDGTIFVSDSGHVIKKIARDKDGLWTVTTLAGQYTKFGHKDGDGKEALLQRVDGIALDSKGNLYMADQDWLRRLSPDGKVVTLNPKGGSGGFGPGLEHDLESVKFNRIMGAGQLACDENDDLFIGDKWNGTWLKIDFKAGKARVIAGGPARGQPEFRSGGPRDGAGNTEAIFHTGGGPSGLAYDRLTKRLYTYTADEHAVRVILPDGMVRTLGPWTSSEKGLHLADGPVKETKGYGWLAGCDLQGRVYIGNRDGLMYRFYRKPAIEGVPALKTPNPLLPWKAAGAKTGAAIFSVTLEAPATDGGKLAAGKAVDCAMAYGAVGEFSGEVKIGDKTSKVSFAPRKAVIGACAATVGQDLVEKAGEPPECRVKIDLTNAGKTDTVEIAPEGGNPVVVSDGTRFVVAYEHSSSVYIRRIGTDGKLIDEKGIKMGGQWEYRPSIACNGQSVVVTGSRRPQHNPWGWNGPGMTSIGRVTAEGKTPERFSVGSDELADGGFAGVLDRAQWKGRKGWPAGIPGGFKNTENGYWPGIHSSVCWDGKTWTAVWIRNKVHGAADTDIFASRVDPATMMPTGEPVLVAGGAEEPGVQTQPAVVGLGDGTSVLVYQSVQPDGRIKVMARLIAGGALTGPARVEPAKK